MAYYLFEAAYTPKAWSAMVKNPQDRAAAVEPAIRKLGGTMERFWLSFGEYDIIGIVQMPDTVAAAGFSLAVSAGGACKNVKTTPLLTVEEGLDAMKRASTCGYKAATAS